MAVITIRHTHADGTLLEGSSKGDGVYEIARSHGFAYFPSIRAIGIRHSRDQVAKRYVIEACATALREAGHEVTVEIDDTPRDRGQVLTDKAERLDDRREALDAKAAKVADKADAQRAYSDRLVEHIPPGQPILIGHHSERRHRRTLDRSRDAAFRGLALSRQADETQRRAEAVGTNLDRSARPDVTARRIKRTEADLRKVQRELDGYTRRHLLHDGTPYIVDKHEPATGTHREALEARKALLEEQLRYDREQLAKAEAAGFKTWGPADVHVGDLVHQGIGWQRVVKVNRATVAVESGHSWTYKVPFTDIRRVQCEHEQASVEEEEE